MSQVDLVTTLPDQGGPQVTEKYAFRCRSCGHLEGSGHAAEASRPLACRVCGAGVIYRHQEITTELEKHLTDPTEDSPARVKDLMEQLRRANPAAKKLDPGNWEILTDADDARLEEIGLTRDQVETHEPWPKGQVPAGHQPRHFSVLATDGAGTRDSSGGEKVEG